MNDSEKITTINVLYNGANLFFELGKMFIGNQYGGFTVIDLGQYNKCSGVWVYLEKEGKKIKLEFRKCPYIVHYELDLRTCN